MSPDAMPRLRLLDLNVLDARELQKLLPKGSYQVERKPLNRGDHGDLGLTEALVILLSPLVIQAISAWLMKKRQRKSIVLTMEKIGADNSTERHSLKINLSDSEAPQADVLKQLVSGMKLDPAILDAVLRKGT
jgi:hypothetical protein